MKEKTVCKKDMCTGCMACIEGCPVHAIKIVDSLTAYNAVIDINKCIKCGVCSVICQNNREIELLKPLSWQQGWAKDNGIRSNASSGGLATAIAGSFVENGGIVCSCLYENGEFKFGFAKNINEVKKFAGSKYVKSNPVGIYKTIKEYIKKGKDVLFVGLPCQANAVRLYVGDKLREKLYTVDLICHGTPSPKLLQDYIKQCGYSIYNVKKIEFRKKGRFGLITDDKSVVESGAVDPYLLAFLCGLGYTENCYQCRYASIERGSDLTLGDSWGSELTKGEQKKGISLVLCQTSKGSELLESTDLVLFDVDIEKAVAANEQLREPREKTYRSERFFKTYKNDNFKRAAFHGLPNKYIRQIIKAILLKMRILKLDN